MFDIVVRGRWPTSSRIRCVERFPTITDAPRTRELLSDHGESRDELSFLSACFRTMLPKATPLSPLVGWYCAVRPQAWSRVWRIVAHAESAMDRITGSAESKKSHVTFLASPPAIAAEPRTAPPSSQPHCNQTARHRSANEASSTMKINPRERIPASRSRRWRRSTGIGPFAEPSAHPPRARPTRSAAGTMTAKGPEHQDAGVSQSPADDVGDLVVGDGGETKIELQEPAETRARRPAPCPDRCSDP